MVLEDFSYIKITTGARLADRYITVQVKEPEREHATRGVLFALVEIEQSWQTNAQIGQTLINTLARQYFRDDREDRLAAFEESLRQVNETLKQFSQAEDPDWPSRLHAVLALALPGEIHVAGVGTVHGWLVRSGKSSPIFERPPGPGTIGKTFGAVLSAPLEPEDHLFFVSSGLYKVVTEQEMAKHVLQADSVAEAATWLTNLLRAKHGRWVNAIALSYQPNRPGQRPPHQPATLLVDATGIGQWTTRGNLALDQARTAVLSAGSWLKEADSRVDRVMRGQVLPRGKQRFAQTKEWTLGQLQRFRAPGRKTPEPAQPQTPASTPTPPFAPPDEAESLIGQPLYTIRNYQEQSAQPDIPPSTTTPGRIPLGFVTRLRSLERWMPRLEWRSLGLVLVAVVLLWILIANVRALSIEQTQERSRQELASELTEYQDLLEEARLAQIFKKHDDAQAALATILDNVPNLFGTAVDAGARQLLDDAQALADELSGTQRLTSVTELGRIEGASDLVQWQGGVVALAPALTFVSTEEHTELPLPTGTPTAFAVFEDGRLLVATENGQGYEYVQPNSQPAQRAAGNADWPSGVALATYFENAYVLSPTAETIWKLAGSGTELSSPSAYTQAQPEIAQAVDLAIDGDIWVVSDTGKILRYRNGQRAEFTPSGLAEPLTSAQSIVTSRTGTHVYVLSGRRIVALTKSGSFAAQYVIDGAEELHAVSVDEQAELFYVLTGDGRVLQVPFSSHLGDGVNSE